jgi:hypothetical protein
MRPIPWVAHVRAYPKPETSGKTHNDPVTVEVQVDAITKLEAEGKALAKVTSLGYFTFGVQVAPHADGKPQQHPYVPASKVQGYAPGPQQHPMFLPSPRIAHERIDPWDAAAEKEESLLLNEKAFKPYKTMPIYGREISYDTCTG